MLIETLRIIFKRDLARLIHEVEQYSDENNIWRTTGQIANSAGNLSLHLVGNLNTYIGKGLGGTNYVRDRDNEFSAKGVPRKDIILMIRNTAEMVDKTLASLGEDILEKEYPDLVFDKKTSTGYMLVHLATHLGYHLGQVNYHRRLIDIQ